MWGNNPFLVLKRIVIGILVVCVIVFTYLETKDIITGPVITISQPMNGSTATTSLVHIIGTVTNASQIYLDGHQIYTDSTGKFDEELILADGYNILELAASDRFKHKTQKRLELVYKIGQKK